MQKKGTKRTLHIDMVVMGSLTALHRQLEESVLPTGPGSCKAKPEQFGCMKHKQGAAV